MYVDQKRKGGLGVVFTLGSSPTVDAENRATTTKRKQPPFRFWFWSGFRFNGIYKMPNKTQHKLYLDTILDLEHQQTPLTTCEFHISVIKRLGLF